MSGENTRLAIRRWWPAATVAALAIALTSLPAAAAEVGPSPSPSAEPTIAAEPAAPEVHADTPDAAADPTAEEQPSGAVLPDGPLEEPATSQPVEGQAVEYINDVVSPIADGIYGAEPVIAPAPSVETVVVEPEVALNGEVGDRSDAAADAGDSIVVGAAAPPLRDLAGAVYGDDTALSQSSRPDLVAAALPRASVADELEVSVTSQLGEGDIPGAAFTADLRWSDQFDPEWVDVAFDASGFSHAYGGDYGDRLQLVVLPACALTTPDLDGCLVAVPLDTDHLAGDVLRAYVPVGGLSAISAQGGKGSSRLVDLGTGVLLDDVATAKWLQTGLPTGKTIVAAVSGASSQSGTFKATDLAPRGTWGVTEPSGGFTYAIPIAMPPVQGGGAPSVSLTYASQSTDGKTSASNSQAGIIGEGWSMPVSYIERLYKPCSDDGAKTAQHCWDSPYTGAPGEAAYVMSLQGNVEELVYQSTSPLGHEATYVAASDPNLKVTRFFGNAGRLAGDADNDDEYFKVETADGTVFHFGFDPTNSANSVAWEPVIGNNSGEPGYVGPSSGNEVAHQAYRFYLDLAVDVSGNGSTYFYKQAINKFRVDTTDKAYVRDTQLARIEYGQRYDSVGAKWNQAQAKVEFDLVRRCVEGSQFYDSLGHGAVDATKCTVDPSPAVAASYPDVPVDLLCVGSATCTPSQNAPVYFSTVRLDRINTSYYDETRAAGLEWIPVESTQLITAFPTTNDGSARSLWLDSVYTRGWGTADAGDDVTTYLTKFSGIHLNNRVDWELTVDAAVTPKRPLDRLRIDHVWTDLGGRIDVTYATAQTDASKPITEESPSLTGTLASFVCPQTGVDDALRYQGWAAANPVDTKLNTAANDQLCYVVTSGAETAIYHRYVVSKVARVDLVGHQPMETHTYFYGGSPAHARADSLLYAVGGAGDTSTFSSYRGFATVSSTVGAITVSAPIAEAPVVSAANLRTGDFNGDGRTDLFTVDSTGRWLLSSGGNGAWVYLNKDASVPLADMRFGDFNGDNRTDVFSSTAAGQWRYSSAGAGPWVNLGSSGYPLSGLRFGDFNGDGKTDVFNINVTQWQYASGGLGAWINLSTSSAAVTALGFAKVDSDTPAHKLATDVLVYSSGWKYSTSGASSWLSLTGGAPSTAMTDVRFGDITGDGVDELITRSATGVWSYYSGASGSAIPMGTAPATLADATLSNSVVGDFTGDGKADLLMQDPSGARKIWSPGASGWATYVAAPGSAVSTAAMTTNQYFRGTGGTLASLDEAVVVPIAETPTVAPADLRYGDFDGDKKTDLFTRDPSGQWKFSSGGTSPWQNLWSDATVPLTDLRFGDFNGDGKTDVFTRAATGRWRVAWSGLGGWVDRTGDSGTPLADLRFGDFNGDGKTDVFSRTSAGQWRYSPSAWDGYISIATESATAVANLRFADFNGDKKTDVFSRQASGLWVYSSGGALSYQNLSGDASVTLAQLRFADVTGDGKADIVTQNADGTWKFSDAGLANWATLVLPPDAPQGSSEFQDMNGDGRADLVVASDNGQRKYASAGSTLWTILMAPASTPGSNATASTSIGALSTVVTVDNDPRLQGVLESSRTIDAAGNVVSRSRQTYSFVTFGKAPVWDRTGPAVTAEHSPHVVQVTSATSQATAGAWSSTSVTTTTFDNPTADVNYKATFQPTRIATVVRDSRFAAKPETSCQDVAYAQRETPYLIVPVSAATYDGGCGSAGTLTGKVQVGYDDGTPGATNQVLSRGLVTTERDYTNAEEFTTSKATYDAYGRIVAAWMPDVATVDNAPASMTWTYPTDAERLDPLWKTTVNQALGATSSTWAERGHGNTVKTHGATDRDYTHYQYDALGLLVAAWAPAQYGHDATPSLDAVFPTAFYRYDVYTATPTLRSTPVAVTSAPFVHPSGDTFVGAPGVGTTRRSITFLDGFGRAIEQHSVAPDGKGKAVLTATRYNEQGQVDWASAPFITDRTVNVFREPGVTNLINPTLASVPTATDYAYDSLGRSVSTSSLYQGSVITVGVGDVPVTSSTEYSGPVTISKAPDGSQTTVTVDTLGRTISQLVDADTATRAKPGYQGQLTQYAYNTLTASFLATDTLAVPATILTVPAAKRVGSQRVTVTDPEGDDTVFESNLAGQRTLMVDPNAGSTGYDYSVNGQTTAVRSAAGTISMEYDVLGRLTKRTSKDGQGVDSSSASWDYVDPNEPGATADLGLLRSSTSDTVTSVGTFRTVQSHIYNDLHQVTSSKVELPESALLGDLSNTDYTTKVAYDGLGQPVSTTVDELGAIPQETILTGYRLSGMAFTLGIKDGEATATGPVTSVVTDVAYSDTGQLTSRKYSNGLVRQYKWDAKTRALTAISAKFPDLTAPVDANGNRQYIAVQNDEFMRDVMGRITQSTNKVSVSVDVDGAGGNPAVQQVTAECFTYDGFNRLASAWTVADASAPVCGTEAPAAVGSAGWDASATAYQASWVYTPAGKIDSLTQSVAAAASKVTGYAYSTDHPAAVTSTTTGAATDSFTYDAAGRMDSRTVNTVTTALGWDVTSSLVESGKPAHASDPSTGQGGHIVYAYDASGQRVLQAVVHDATHTGTATAYVASGEITDTDTTVPAAATSMKATRYYTFGGSTVAVRTTTGLALVLGDEQGSVSVTMPLTVDPVTRVVSQATVADALNVTRTAYTPFGVLRGDDNLALSRGWLGQVEDRVSVSGTSSSATGLTYLNARYYDAALGRFVSPDPLVDPGNPVTLDPFQYAGNNPVAFSDANGMCYRGKGARGYNGGTLEARCGAPTDKELEATVTGTDIQSTLAAQRDCRDKGKCGRAPGQTPVACAWNKYCRGTPSADMKAFFHGVLDMIGLIPVLGEWADGANAVWYAADGDRGNALISAGSAMPLAGWGFTAVKWLKPVVKSADEAAPLAKDALKAAECSFEGDTKVLMADGSTKPIGDIKPGDRVMAEDPETGKRGPRTVTHVWVHGDDLVDFRIADDVVTTTEDHPFWNATDRQWEGPEEFDAGDRVLTADGNLLVTRGLVPDSWHTGNAYNLTVNDIHTFYVVVADEAVLVHNCPWSLDGLRLTQHGQDQLKARGFDDVEIATLMASNRTFEQLDGAVARLGPGSAPGLSNVLITSEGELVTVIRDKTAKELNRLAQNYGWQGY